MLSTLNDVGSLLLVLAVLRQIRPRPLGFIALAWPVVVVLVVAAGFFTGVPVNGHDLLLVIALTVLGIIFGLSCAATTHVYAAPNGTPIARAGVAAAVFWLLGMALRLAFVLYVEHGGAQSIGEWSRSMHVTGAAWGAALLLMAIGEVLARTVGLVVKRQTLIRRNLRFGQQTAKENIL
jgi:hypothetical protein